MQNLDIISNVHIKKNKQKLLKLLAEFTSYNLLQKKKKIHILLFAHFDET